MACGVGRSPRACSTPHARVLQGACPFLAARLGAARIGRRGGHEAHGRSRAGCRSRSACSCSRRSRSPIRPRSLLPGTIRGRRSPPSAGSPCCGRWLRRVVLTAFYMFRAVFMTFFGASRVTPGRRITSTSRRCRWRKRAGALLAAGSVAAGWINLPEPLRHALGVGRRSSRSPAACCPGRAARGRRTATEIALMALTWSASRWPASRSRGCAWARYRATSSPARMIRSGARSATAITSTRSSSGLHRAARSAGSRSRVNASQMSRSSRASLERPARRCRRGPGFARLQTGDTAGPPRVRAGLASRWCSCWGASRG